MLDDELITLFRGESGERLQRMDHGVLRLEANPGDFAVIEELFRDAHSLKGAARMLGFEEVERVAHAFEDLLGALRRARSPADAATVDRLTVGVRELTRIVGAALAGEPSPAVEAPTGGDVPAASDAEPQSTELRLETIRVETRRLDDLLTHSGELTVTRTRLAQRLSEIDDLLAFCEDGLRSVGSVGSDRSVGRAEHLERLTLLLERLKGAAAEDNARLDYAAQRIEEGISNLRLLPFSTLFDLFPRTVRDRARQQGKDVRLVTEGGDTGADKRIIEEMKDPLMHMLHNAVDHGIEAPEQRESSGKPRMGTIRVQASRTEANLVIEISDDGRGLDVEAIEETASRRRVRRPEELEAMSEAQVRSLIFASGFSTRTVVTGLSGRGVGMDVVREQVERLKGSIEVESVLGRGCAFRMRLPLTLTTAHVLIAESGGLPYAFPVDSVRTTLLVRREDIFTVRGTDTVHLDGQPLSVVALGRLLEIPAAPAAAGSEKTPCIVVSSGEERLGVLVDALLDEQQVVVKPLGMFLKRVRNVSGTSILGTGRICMVLNPADLLRSVRRVGPQAEISAASGPQAEACATRRLLVADDSIAARTQVKRILEAAGYEVVTAVDGLDAYRKLTSAAFDAAVLDVEMPNLDGISLTARLRQEQRFADLPIVVLTTLGSDEDRKRGMDAGASAYLIKSAFDQGQLIEVLERLI